jgi:hypothetical protein
LKGVHPQTRKIFEENFVEEVFNRCAGHWYPTDPKRGSGYRSVISDAHIDPILLKACHAARLSAAPKRREPPRSARAALPQLLARTRGP